jgi:DNA-binding transcriptional ArsR family regulator
MADLLTSIRAEIDARIGELEPLLAEYEELLAVADAFAPDGSTTPAAPAPADIATKTARSAQAPAKARRPAGGRRRTRARRPSITPTGRAILAALEHGSHTVAELVVVTALPAPDVRRDLRPLLDLGAITKTDRDGKPAYALSAPVG